MYIVLVSVWTPVVLGGLAGGNNDITTLGKLLLMVNYREMPNRKPINFFMKTQAIVSSQLQ